MSSATGRTWLPQPPEWADLAADAQTGRPDSTLELYRQALALRAEHRLGLGTLEWLDGYDEGVIAYRNGDVLVIANAGTTPASQPSGHEVLLASDATPSSLLGPDATVWLRA